MVGNLLTNQRPELSDGITGAWPYANLSEEPSREYILNMKQIQQIDIETMVGTYQPIRSHNRMLESLAHDHMRTWSGEPSREDIVSVWN
jgi:hypothetical protein